MTEPLDKPAGVGRFIAIVGPSGVGKDSIIDGLCEANPRMRRCQRVITRPADAGGEVFESVEPAAFEAAVASGAFVLWWHAHGLSYGIPRAVLDWTAQGYDVIGNLSRGKLEQAAQVFDTLIVLNITASPETLAARLEGRGRETAADIRSRLARPAPPLPATVPVITLANDGPLGDTLERARMALADAGPSHSGSLAATTRETA
ncbi:MAG: phosphonate metabolism protein/1,5-bisphosphokinase (PRPP-forming) PhnN [Pseudomonadota bacterium]